MGINSRSLQRKQYGKGLSRLEGEKVRQGQRRGKESGDLGTALCDSLTKNWRAAELQILLAARLLNDGAN